jgi:hypothetical protein
MGESQPICPLAYHAKSGSCPFLLGLKAQFIKAVARNLKRCLIYSIMPYFSAIRPWSSLVARCWCTCSKHRRARPRSLRARRLTRAGAESHGSLLPQPDPVTNTTKCGTACNRQKAPPARSADAGWSCRRGNKGPYVPDETCARCLLVLRALGGVWSAVWLAGVYFF